LDVLSKLLKEFTSDGLAKILPQSKAFMLGLCAASALIYAGLFYTPVAAHLPVWMICHSGWLIVSFIFSGCMWLSGFYYDESNWVRNLRREQNTIAYLESLSPEEKGIMRQFTEAGVNSKIMGPHEPGVDSLIRAGVLYQSDTPGPGNTAKTISFTPILKKYALKHREELKRKCA
jgi:hypothetical protein